MRLEFTSVRIDQAGEGVLVAVAGRVEELALGVLLVRDGERPKSIARWDRRPDRGLHASYELRLGEDRFRLTVSGDGIDVARGDADHPDATGLVQLLSPPEIKSS